MSESLKKVTWFIGFWTILYIGVIVASNILLIQLQPVHLFGIVVPPAIVAFGFTFVFRDFSQREMGHYVLLAIAAAAFLTYVLAGPAVAFASVTAFVVAELADWLIYSLSKRPFAQRILISSLVSVPVDTLVFYQLLGILDPTSLIAGVVIKLIGAFVFWAYLQHRDNKIEKQVQAA